MMLSRLLATSGLAIYAVVAMMNGLDRVSAINPAVERVVPRPFRAQADRSAAALDITLQRTSAALPHSAAAVSHDPVDPDSTALLGSARLAAGNEQGAADAFRVAARFGWRNVSTQLYWFAASLQAGNFGVAADRADAVLRAHPGFAERDALLEPLESNPAARKILINHLAEKPRWRTSYLRLLRDTDEAIVNRRMVVLTDLGATGFSLGCDEVSQFVTALIDRDRNTDAKRVWNANCRTQQMNGLLADPAFQLIDSQPAFPFGWQVMRSGEVGVQSSPRDGANGSIQIGNSGSISQLVLFQRVSLPPGNYLVQLAVGGDKKLAVQRLRFSFVCNGRGEMAGFAQGRGILDGPTVQVRNCQRQRFELWLTPGAGLIELKRLDVRSSADRAFSVRKVSS